MSSVIRGLISGDFLDFPIPFVRPAATAGVISAVMAIGLHILGFAYSQSVVTAVFAITGVGGLGIAVIGAIAYCIIAAAINRGNNMELERGL